MGLRFSTDRPATSAAAAAQFIDESAPQNENSIEVSKTVAVAAHGCEFTKQTTHLEP